MADAKDAVETAGHQARHILAHTDADAPNHVFHCLGPAQREMKKHILR